MRGWSHGRHWLPGDVEREMTAIAKRYGRMPSTSELRAEGRNDLAVKASRSAGGMRGVAERIGTAIKDSETARGRVIEDRIEAELRAARFSVERQTCKAPFDLLVDGARVDVKSARYTNYGNQRGYVFALNKVPATCDLYLLCCVSGDGEILTRYYVPSSRAQVRTITITEHGKYDQFRNAIDQLRPLVEVRP